MERVLLRQRGYFRFIQDIPKSLMAIRFLQKLVWKQFAGSVVIFINGCKNWRICRKISKR